MSILDRQLERFIEMERLVRAKDSGQWRVWQLTKDSFMKRHSIAYWRFPLYIVQGDNRQLADILIVDQQQGLIILDIYDQSFASIDIEAAYEKMERHVDSVRTFIGRDSALAPYVQVKGLIALPQLSTAEWHEDARSLLLKEDLTLYRMQQKIKQAPTTMKSGPMSDMQFQALQALLSGIRMRPVENVPTTDSSRLNAIYELSMRPKAIDRKQDILGKIIAPGQQRIRGITGTGKTAVQCQKAAHMHLKYPHWHIGFVHYSEDLAPSLIEQIDYWLRYFSNNAVDFEQARPHIHVHSFFGSAGFFAEICQAHQYAMPNVSQFQRQHRLQERSELIGALCQRFLHDIDVIHPLYDALLIDEGECFMTSDTYKYEERQPFYWLSYELTKPIDGEKVNRRLIWAYDESTDLTKMLTPTARDMFGAQTTFRHFVTGMHKGGLLKSDLMLTCYRTPAPVITAAHTIGMGLLRKKGMLAGVTTKDAWQHLGYDVLKGVFQEGEQIVLHRPPAHSPNQIAKLTATTLMQLQLHQEREAELDQLATALHVNQQQDGLDVSRHIIVLTLGEDPNLQREIADGLAARGIKTYLPRDVQDDRSFYEEGAVTVSTVSRARGQEAYVIYLIGLEKLAMEEANVTLRNELFNALMRTKGWCYLFGLGDGEFYDELSEAIQTGNTISFTFKKSS